MKEKKQERGLSVAEALILVFFLSALSFILIPNFNNAKNRAAQRSTMADMVVWGQAVTTYLSIHAIPPTNPIP